ncbi:MAG TPA: YMGG-like glycine zipper-containing protein, partial [Myxococcota bacterium]|nr:YMGG-like glycine zipper-containing protein [Myxococcota bacterium]
GATVKGAAKGALVGVAAGAVAGNAGKGAAAGAVAGGLIGGVRRHRETKEMVTETRTNPDYTAYVEAKNAFRAALDACMRQRGAAAAKAAQP